MIFEVFMVAYMEFSLIYLNRLSFQKAFVLSNEFDVHVMYMLLQSSLQVVKFLNANNVMHSAYRKLDYLTNTMRICSIKINFELIKLFNFRVQPIILVHNKTAKPKGSIHII